jgi:hypothetical protein
MASTSSGLKLDKKFGKFSHKFVMFPTNLNTFCREEVGGAHFENLALFVSLEIKNTNDAKSEVRFRKRIRNPWRVHNHLFNANFEEKFILDLLNCKRNNYYELYGFLSCFQALYFFIINGFSCY